MVVIQLLIASGYVMGMQLRIVAVYVVALMIVSQVLLVGHTQLVKIIKLMFTYQLLIVMVMHYHLV